MTAELKIASQQHGSQQMTVDLFKELNAHDEINSWFEEIKKRLN